MSKIKSLKIKQKNNELSDSIPIGCNAENVDMPDGNNLNNFLDNFKQEILLQCHPIGSYYWTDGEENPADLFGGEWEHITQARTLISTGALGRKDLYAGDIGGSYQTTLTVDNMPEHTHTFTGTAASHKHDFAHPGEGGSAMVIYNKTNIGISYSDGFVVQPGSNAYVDTIKGYGAIANTSITPKGTNSKTGGNMPFEILPPYLAANLWKRTA